MASRPHPKVPCIKCGELTVSAYNNKSGLCKKCKPRNKEQRQRAYEYNLRNPRRYRIQKAVCYKCKKSYKARKDQHLRYSMCDHCKKENEVIARSQQWIHRAKTT